RRRPYARRQTRRRRRPGRPASAPRRPGTARARPWTRVRARTPASGPSPPRTDRLLEGEGADLELEDGHPVADKTLDRRARVLREDAKPVTIAFGTLHRGARGRAEAHARHARRGLDRGDAVVGDHD